MKLKIEKSKLKINHVADLVQWLVVGVLVFTSISLVLSNFDTPLRFRVFNINSGSMAPEIKLGNLVFVRPQENYFPNDIISFGSKKNPAQVTTHRIVQISEAADSGRVTYTTKGDGNDDVDMGFVLKEQVIGKVVFKLPLLGFLVSIAKTQTGFILLVVIPATILVYGELRNIKTEIAGGFAYKNEKEKTKNKKEERKISKFKITAAKNYKTTSKKRENVSK